MELHEGIALLQHDSLYTGSAQVWADLGCGAGFFTKALASLLPAQSMIYAIDQKLPLPAKRAATDGVIIQPLQRDFARDDLPIEQLDGILMANSLHYVKGQVAFVQKVRRYLKADHYFLIVEYDSERANPWVPYPLSYRALQRCFTAAGYQTIHKLQERPPVRGFAKMYTALITS